MRVVTWMTNGRTDGKTEACLYYITVLLLCCIDIYIRHTYIYMLLIHVLQASGAMFLFIYFLYFFFYFGHINLL